VSIPVGKGLSKSYSPIIPNSYLIVSTDEEEEDWFLELFASPTDKIGIIIAISVGLLIIIFSIVFIRYKKEKAMDSEEKNLGLQF